MSHLHSGIFITCLLSYVFSFICGLDCMNLSMDIEEKRITSGYAKPPWIFKGRQENKKNLSVAFQECLKSSSLLNFVSYFGFSALYQIHLVKAETARAFIPKEFRLVEAFGYIKASPRGSLISIIIFFKLFNHCCSYGIFRYTLGGFFLASYDDSPAGVFDEVSSCLSFFSLLTQSYHPATFFDRFSCFFLRLFPSLL